jgi:uncharacterized delta-60 repeat protein
MSRPASGPMPDLRRSSMTLAGVILFGQGSASWSSGPPGDLDLSFGREGFAVVDVDGTLDGGQGVAIQPDGKIVLVGYAAEGKIPQYALLRVHPDGSADRTFARRGVRTLDVSGGAGYGVAIQPDGKILVVGGAVVGGNTYQGLARFMSDGRVYRSFGNEGIVVNTAGLPGYELAIQADGKVLSIAPDMLARYEPDGSLDPSFGAGGVVVPIPDAIDLALLDNGMILVAGTDVFPDPSVVVARYTASGELDPTFGEGGEARTPVGEYCFMTAIAVQSDGGIVVTGGVGISQPNLQHYLLVRYLEDGTLDTAFGTDGIVITPVPGDHYGRDVALQVDGRIVVVGNSGNFPRSDFTVVRYGADGQLDVEFGNDGLVITRRNLFDQPQAGPNAVAIQDDGKIVVAGTGQRDSYDLALLRYLAA